MFLLVKSDSDVKVGTPLVSGASVEVKVLEHGRAKKIRVMKMKRRKRYRRTYGHRQGFTDIEVVKISVGAAKAAAKETTKKEAKETEEAKQ